MKSAEKFVKRIMSNFDEYSFYMGESMELDAGVALCFYKDDGVTPFFYFFRDGLSLQFPGFGKSLYHPVKL